MFSPLWAINREKTTYTLKFYTSLIFGHILLYFFNDFQSREHRDFLCRVRHGTLLYIGLMYKK